MWRPLLLSSFAIAMSAASALASIAFHPAVSYDVGGKPEGGTLADFDHDGDLDLAVSIDSPNAVLVFANNGNGSFAAPTTLLTGNATGPEGLAAADFDGDGVLDLAIVLFGTNQVRLAIGDGTGHFVLGAAVSVGVEPSVVVAADFDGDGLIDAAVNNRVSGDMSVLLNDGEGGFAPAVAYAVGDETRCIAAGDVTGDGRTDLAVSARDSRIVRLFENQGDGTFALFRDLSLGSILEPQGVTFADFDRDGALDVVTATSGNELQEHPSVFLQNNGGREGIWVGPINGQTLPGVSPIGIAAADFDLDGFVDVATSNADTDNLSVNHNGGIGIFSTPFLFPVGGDPETPFLLCGDLDRNGSPDLVSLNQDSENVSVLLNQNSAPAGVESPAAARLRFYGAAPHPVVSATTLSFELARSGDVDLAIFDVAGRRVRTLEHRALDAGLHRAGWDGRNEDGTRLSAGVYVARLEASGEARTQRIVLTH